MTPQFDLLAICSAVLLITTFAVVARRGFMDWLNAYRYQSIALAGVTAIIAFVTGVWEIYIAAGLTFVIKAIVIPRVFLRITGKLAIKNKIEVDPYISIRSSVILSALLVVFSYFITEQFPFKSDKVVNAFLPVSIAMFLIGIFVMIVRKKTLNQVVGLLILENGLFLFATSLTHGISLVIEVGIFLDVIIGVVISAILMQRISYTFDSMSVTNLEKLRDE